MIETAIQPGPATVTAAEGRKDHVQIVRPDGTRGWARLALAVPYVPKEGDEVLVFGGYVIGVLRASGPTEWKFAEALRIESSEVTIRAGRIELAARKLVQKARDAFHWVSELLHFRTRRTEISAEASCDVRAGRAEIRAEGDVDIDGKTINLG